MKIIICVSVLLMLCCYSVRFVSFNKKTEKPVIEKYNQGEYVEYLNNYFISEYENLNGYSIKVSSDELMTIEDYFIRNNKSFEKFKENADKSEIILPKYVLNVSLDINNKNSDGSGIDIIETRILSSKYALQVNSFLFKYIFKDMEGFNYLKLKENSEYKITLPYCLIPADEKILGEKDLLRDDLYLNITQYPVKKMIKLNVEILK